MKEVREESIGEEEESNIVSRKRERADMPKRKRFRKKIKLTRDHISTMNHKEI